jgi:hypothetical protein
LQVDSNSEGKLKESLILMILGPPSMEGIALIECK